MSDTLTEPIAPPRCGINISGVHAAQIAARYTHGIVWIEMGTVALFPAGSSTAARLDNLEAIVAKLTDEIARLRAES